MKKNFFNHLPLSSPLTNSLEQRKLPYRSFCLMLICKLHSRSWLICMRKLFSTRSRPKILRRLLFRSEQRPCFDTMATLILSHERGLWFSTAYWKCSNACWPVSFYIWSSGWHNFLLVTERRNQDKQIRSRRFLPCLPNFPFILLNIKYCFRIKYCSLVIMSHDCHIKFFKNCLP